MRAALPLLAACAFSAVCAAEPAVQVVDSGRPGPTVLVVAGLHGDEPAGVEAARRIAQRVPSTGRLVVLAEANPRAGGVRARSAPGEPDLNRAFPGDSPLAARIWSLVREVGPAAVLDLHEADPARPLAAESARTLIFTPTPGAAALVLDTLERLRDRLPGPPFGLLSGAPPGSLNREVSERLAIPVITVETAADQDFQTRVAEQVEVVLAVLEALGLR